MTTVYIDIRDDDKYAHLGLARAKREGGYWVEFPNHPLAGRSFIASKRGPDISTVIKRKENGLFLCITDDGVKFDYPERHLKVDVERGL